MKALNILTYTLWIVGKSCTVGLCGSQWLRQFEWKHTMNIKTHNLFANFFFVLIMNIQVHQTTSFFFFFFLSKNRKWNLMTMPKSIYTQILRTRPKKNFTKHKYSTNMKLVRKLNCAETKYLLANFAAGTKSPNTHKSVDMSKNNQTNLWVIYLTRVN